MRTPGRVHRCTRPGAASELGRGGQLDCTHFDGPCLYPARNAATRWKAVPRSVDFMVACDQQGDCFVEVAGRQRRRGVGRPRSGQALGARAGVARAELGAERVLHRRRPRGSPATSHWRSRRRCRGPGSSGRVVADGVARRAVGDGVVEHAAVGVTVARSVPATTLGAVAFGDCDAQYCWRLVVTVGSMSLSGRLPPLAWSS